MHTGLSTFSGNVSVFPHGRLSGAVVEETGYSESYGNFVVLRHSDRLKTTYNHCSKILASQGEQLARGDRIALVGSTGISTGPHLHFEVVIEGLKADPLISLEVEEYEA